MTRRRTAAALAALVAAIALVALGRFERDDHADEQNAGIERVRETVGELDAPSLEGFRMLQDFQCLIYGSGGRTFALELCADREGRVVEAIDRRDGVRIWSLREDPELARVRVERARFEEVIGGMCAECRAIFERGRAGQAR